MSKTRIYAVAGPSLPDTHHQLIRATNPGQVRRHLLSQYDIHVAEQEEIVEALQQEHAEILDVTATEETTDE